MGNFLLEKNLEKSIVSYPSSLGDFDNITGAYIHIPFCKRRCFYCDFPISVLGDAAINQHFISVDKYVEFLCREIKFTKFSLNFPSNSLRTIFFGGGTPSLLEVQHLEDILIVIEENFGIASDAEISMEMDPNTFSRAKLEGFQGLGINRVSLGVQSFEDDLLKVCGRSHSVNDIFAAVEIINQVGISNWSLDLISGLPNQSLSQWRDSLSKAIDLKPNHISCYDLVLEPVTVFGKKYQPGDKPLPTDEMAAQMYRLAVEMLTDAGYNHYEISNYAQKGYECRHNRIYWENKPYYGFGMGATSYVDGRRFSRPRIRKDYYAWVEEMELSFDWVNFPKTDQYNQLLETLMLGLRLAEGVSLSKIRETMGNEILTKIYNCLESYSVQGWVEINLVDENIRLMDPDGFLFSNTILSSLFNALEDG